MEGDNRGVRIEENQQTVQDGADAKANACNDTLDYKNILLRVDKDMLDKIDEFKIDRGLSNRTEAIRYLMTIGIKEVNTIGRLKTRMDKVEERIVELAKHMELQALEDL